MLNIYTDGAYSSSRDQGGWAYVILYKNQIIFKDYGGIANTTNNRMEIEGVLQALEKVKTCNKSITIHSDSMYVIGTLSLNWAKNVNLDLWEKFNNYDLTNVNFKHVKGHASNIHNNLCDTLAVLGSHLKLK